MARLYSLGSMRESVGENDPNNTTTNKRLRQAGELSQSDFVMSMRNLRTIPITDDTEEERELVNFGGVAYFYYLENGDEKMVDKYKEKIKEHIKFKYGRPGTVTVGAL